MTTFHVSTRVDIAPLPRRLARLRALLLSELAVHTEQGASARATLESLRLHYDADSTFERELARRSIATADHAIVRVRHALGRLDAGAYGICETCAEPIPLERLEAIPYTSQCVACPAPPVPTGPLG